MRGKAPAVLQERYQTGDHTVMRQMNLSAILHHLRENAPISALLWPT